MKKYSVIIDRIAYSSRTVTIEANSEEEAEQLADDLAGSFDYSEHTSEYEFHVTEKI